MNPKEAKQLVSHMERIRSRRFNRWRRLSQWICPWRGIFDERLDRFEKDEPARFTHAASSAALRGASGMTSGMTPRNISWFKPMFMDSNLMEASGARGWLDKLDLMMKDALAEGGFYQAIQNFNLDLIWAGCALLYTETAEDKVLRTTSCQLGTWLVDCDSTGRLEFVATRLSFTGQEAARVFGMNALSPQAQDSARKNPLAPIRVWHLVAPAESGKFAFASYYWEPRANEFLKQGGYYEMPYFFACWNEGVTPYGTGPGDECLADAMQMDLLERHKLSGLGRLVDPPVACPATLKDALHLAPGAINYVGERDMIRPILDMNPYAHALSGIMQEIDIVSRRLDTGLMASIFSSMPLDQRPNGMSATEFLERKRESLQQLGPVMASYEPRVLTPLLFRCAQALERAGLVPTPPEELRGIELFMKMDFISPMANALRQTGAETTRALFQDVALMYQATQRQELFDKIDLDQITDELAAGLGAPGSVIRSDADVAKLREERAKQQEAQAQAQLAMQAMQGGGQ